MYFSQRSLDLFFRSLMSLCQQSIIIRCLKCTFIIKEAMKYHVSNIRNSLCKNNLCSSFFPLTKLTQTCDFLDWKHFIIQIYINKLYFETVYTK